MKILKKLKVLMLIAVFAVCNFPQIKINEIEKKVEIFALGQAQGQGQGFKQQPNLGGLENAVTSNTNMIKNIVLTVIGIVLGIALIFVIWNIASSNPQAKNYAISWVVAVIFYAVAWVVIG